MASKRQIAANRRNAKRSTGPRSLSGKARASKNALRHGLAISLAHDPKMSKDVRDLAKALSFKSDGIANFENAIALAETTLDLRRIRAVRAAIYREILPPGSGGASDKLDGIAKIDRYERRALSRRRRTIRALENLDR